MGLFKKRNKEDKETYIKKRDGNPDVHYVPDESERMNWAMEKAKLTFNYFAECLKEPKANQQYLSVKGRFEEESKIEHIWLTDVSVIDKNKITGKIGNEPIDVTHLKLNQQVEITKDEVSDWMIIEDGRLIGGYTIRALREGKTGNDLKQFDASLGGMYIDEGEDYFEANFKTPEGAIVSLEEAYNKNDLDTAVQCKNFLKEAEMMLHKTMKFEPTEEIINKTAEALHLSYLQVMKEDGMPNFKDVKRAFQREKISDDHYIITEILYHPDGKKSAQKLNTFRTNNEWKVLSVVD